MITKCNDALAEEIEKRLRDFQREYNKDKTGFFNNDGLYGEWFVVYVETDEYVDFVTAHLQNADKFYTEREKEYFLKAITAISFAVVDEFDYRFSVSHKGKKLNVTLKIER